MCTASRPLLPSTLHEAAPRFIAMLLVVAFGSSLVVAQDREGAQADRQIMQQVEELLEQAEALRQQGRPDAAEAVLDQARDLRERLSRARQATPPRRDELRSVTEQIEQLTRHAEQLRSAGNVEEAEKAMEQIQHLRERIQQSEQRAPRDEASEIINGLEQGIRALQAMGRTDDADHLRRLAIELAERRALGDRPAGPPDPQRRERPPRHRGVDEQRQAAQQRLEVLRMAHHAMREAERPDAAEMLEQMIHAAELRLEGREPEGVREPDREQQIGLLAGAAAIWEELGNETKAHALASLVEQMNRGDDRPRPDRPAERPDRPADRGDRPAELRDRPADRGDRPQAQQQRRVLEVMRSAAAALQQANRADTLELLERAMHAMEMDIAGRDDEEANEIRRRAPEIAQQIEILAYSADLWKEFGDAERAAALDELAQQFRQIMQQREGGRSDAPRGAGAERRIDELQQQVRQLSDEIQQLRQQLQQQRSPDQRDRVR